MKQVVDGMRPWLRFSASYLGLIFGGHLVWEIVQLPLYTIFWEYGPGTNVYAVVHCTLGDVLIGAGSLAPAVLLFGRDGPGIPKAYLRVAIATVAIAVSYTVFSEWYNTQVGRDWAYSTWMPLVPPLDIGLAPLLQWTVIPAVAFWWLRPRKPSLAHLDQPGRA